MEVELELVPVLYALLDGVAPVGGVLSEAAPLPASPLFIAGVPTLVEELGGWVGSLGSLLLPDSEGDCAVLYAYGRWAGLEFSPLGVGAG